MKKLIISLLKYGGTFCLLIGIFVLSLYFICFIPTSQLEGNVRESSEILLEQGPFYLLSKIFAVRINNYTDAVIINEAYSVDSDAPYESAMKMRKNYQKDITINEIEDVPGEGITANIVGGEEVVSTDYESIGELYDFLHGSITTSIDYGRYWHGYMILYRLLLTFLSILQIRTVVFVLFLCLYIYFIYLIQKRFGKNIAWIFAVSLLCSGYFSASYSLESTPIFLVMIISAIILLLRIDRIKDFSFFIFIVGCIANFVDYLTVPVITLGMLCGIYLLKLMEDEKDWKCCVKFLIFHSFIWLAGYACTWLTKWILYDMTILHRTSMVETGLSQSMYRMTRGNEYMYSETHYLNTIIKVLSTSSLYILFSMWFILIKNHFQIKNESKKSQVIPFLFLAGIPVVWFIALANHTMMHYYFTYRNTLIFMLGMLLAFYSIFFKRKRIEYYKNITKK